MPDFYSDQGILYQKSCVETPQQNGLVERKHRLCLAFASTTSQHCHRFDPHSRHCAFLEYPFDVKGYKLLDLDAHKIFVSRDDIFHESLFPFHTPSLHPSSIISSTPPDTNLHLPDLDANPPSTHNSAPPSIETQTSLTPHPETIPAPPQPPPQPRRSTCTYQPLLTSTNIFVPPFSHHLHLKPCLLTHCKFPVILMLPPHFCPRILHAH